MKPAPTVHTALLLGLAFWGGCASAPEPRDAPAIELPAQWSADTEISAQAPDAWLEDLESPALNRLVDEALAHNADLQITAARFAQAVAEARIAGAELRPAAGLGLNAARQKINNFGPQSVGGVRFENYDLALNLSWEIDLWGRLRDQTSAAIASAEASRAELLGARLSLAAQVAKAWLDFTEARQQLELAATIAESYRKNLNTLETRFERGLSEGLDLRFMRTQSASAEAEIPARRRALDLAARRLQVLLGRYPSAEMDAPPTFPVLPEQIPAGLPAELLSRRPDLVAAERRLAAANRELRASKKELLPQIRLTGSTGTASQDFHNLLDSNFSVWSLGANLTQPIFQGGRIRANIDRSASLRDQATAAYRATALQAFLEVETALAAEAFLENEVAALGRAAEEAAAAESLAWEAYARGTADVLNVLDARRTAANTRSRLIGLQNLLLQNRVDLYLALGGGFSTVPPAAAETRTPL